MKNILHTVHQSRHIRQQRVSASFRMFLLLLLVSGITYPVSAQQGSETPEITLTQAIQTALANNTQMKQALLTVKDAEQQVRAAWGNVMPSVAASASYTRNLEIPVQFIPAIIFDPNANEGDLMPVAFGTDNTWNGGFSASQILFSGQAFVGISASELYQTAQTEALRATAQGVVTQTRVAYYQTLIARKQVELYMAQINRVKENLTEVKALAQQGFTDDYSVLQLEVQLANLQPQLTTAQFTLENAKRDLLDVLGLPLDLPYSVVGDLNTFDIYSTSASEDVNESLKKVDTAIPLVTDHNEAVFAEAFDDRGDLRILDVQSQLQRKNLMAQKAQYLPTLAASYNLMWSAAQPGTPVFFGTEETRARSQVLGISLQLPIFTGFQREASIQQTKIQLKNLEIQQEQTQKTAQKEVITAQQSIEQAYQNQAAMKKAVEQATLGYERALARQKAGVGSQQEVTDADLQLRQAEIGYAQTVFGYLIGKAQYDQAIGQVPFVDDIKTIQKNIDLK